MTCDKLVVFSGSSTNKTDLHDIAEILFKVALNTIKQTNKHNFVVIGGIIHVVLTTVVKSVMYLTTCILNYKMVNK